MTQVNLSLKDIYEIVCEKDKENIRNLIKEKLTDQAIKDALEGDKGDRVK